MKLRVGILGCTGTATEQCRALFTSDFVEVVACADQSEERALAFRNEFPIPRAYDDFEEMVTCEELDLVRVCTPLEQRAFAAAVSIKSGIKTLLDVPLAASSHDARRLAETARSNGNCLLAANPLRYIRQVSFLRERFNNGQLGDIRFGRCHFDASGLTAVAPDPPNLAGQPALYQAGIEILDLMLWLMGDVEPESVLGAVYPPRPLEEIAPGFEEEGAAAPEPGDRDDHVCGFVRFAGGQALSFDAELDATIQVPGGSVQSIVTDRATVTFSSALHHPSFVTITSRNGDIRNQLVSGPFATESPHQLIVEDVLSALGEGRPFQPGGLDCALRSHFIADALYRSDTRGSVVGASAGA